MTSAFGGQRSIQLSYGCIMSLSGRAEHTVQGWVAQGLDGPRAILDPAITAHINAGLMSNRGLSYFRLLRLLPFQ